MTAFVPSLKTQRPWTATTRARGLAELHLLPQSMTTIAAVESTPTSITTSTTMLPSGETFAPIVPDTSTLIAFAAIVVLSAVAVWVWANQVVPVSRTNLALSKRNGPVKEYLEELRAAEQLELSLQNATTTTTGTSTVNANMSAVGETDETLSNKISAMTTSSMEKPNTRALERWLFTDWLQKKETGKPGRQKEPALPVLKNAKWNSGDNPVLVATALIMAGVLFTAVTERVAEVVF